VRAHESRFFFLATHEIARRDFSKLAAAGDAASLNARRLTPTSGVSLGRHFHRYYFSVSFSRATNKDRASGHLNYL